MVIAMLETADFFQEQIQQCNSLAEQASDKTDRKFWLDLAHRWQELLETGHRGGPNLEDIRSLRPARTIYTKRRRVRTA